MQKEGKAKVKRGDEADVRLQVISIILSESPAWSVTLVSLRYLNIPGDKPVLPCGRDYHLQ